MSQVLETRARILGAFDDAGVARATGGKFSAPCVLVEAGDPWAEPATMRRGRLVRWRLTALAGKPDTDGAFEALGELVDGVDDALRTIPGVSLPTWGQPLDMTLANVAYAASVATIQLHTEDPP